MRRRGSRGQLFKLSACVKTPGSVTILPSMAAVMFRAQHSNTGKLSPKTKDGSSSVRPGALWSKTSHCTTRLPPRQCTAASSFAHSSADVGERQVRVDLFCHVEFGTDLKDPMFILC